MFFFNRKLISKERERRAQGKGHSLVGNLYLKLAYQTQYLEHRPPVYDKKENF